VELSVRWFLILPSFFFFFALSLIYAEMLTCYTKLVPPILAATADARGSTAFAMMIPTIFLTLCASYALCLNFVPSYREPADHVIEPLASQQERVRKFRGRPEDEESGQNIALAGMMPAGRSAEDVMDRVGAESHGSGKDKMVVERMEVKPS
jgi:hypothetical protein